jgi:hypothetical protein
VRKKLLASALFAPYKNSAMLVATALLTTLSTIRALPASLTLAMYQQIILVKVTKNRT